MKNLTELSLFTGAGGGVLASKLLGWKTVQYVEWDSYCQKILAARIKDGILDDAPIHGDVNTFDGTFLRGVVDVVSAGFPCFAAGTLVTTSTGLKPIENVCVGDLVLTHLGRWRRVNAIMRRADAQTRRIRSHGLPAITCSQNHPFYARALEKTWDLSTCLYSRRISDPGRVEATALSANHYIGTVLPPAEPCDLSVDELFLFGMFLDCGRADPDCGRVEPGEDTVAFTGSVRDEQPFADKFRDLGLTIKRRTCNKTYSRFEVQGAPPILFDTAHVQKSIPGWTLCLPADAAKAFLSGYLFRHTHETKHGLRLRTSCKGDALSVVLLAQRGFGVVASVNASVDGTTMFFTVNLPVKNTQPPIGGGIAWKRVRSNMSAGVRDVFNIAVEEDNTYVADGAIVFNCQPFSVAGKQGASDDERNRWPDTIRIVREVRPKFAFMENVPGLLTGKHGYFGTILGDLAESGYDACWTCIPAAAVGAKHRRDRLWILASRT